MDSQRRSAHQILETVKDSAHEELRRSAAALAFAGVAGGVSMGLTGLGSAVMQSEFGAGHDALTMLLYPLGFVAVIIGRGQLFTENTLYPVVLVLDEGKHLMQTLRLWLVVFLSNVLGAFIFAGLATRTAALEPQIRQALIELGTKAMAPAAAHIFWSGVVGGWIIALVAWMVSASHWTIAQMTITYMLTYLVGLGHFAHCIAGSGESLAAVLGGASPVGSYLHWIVFATLGNICGGVFMVSILNWGQVNPPGVSEEKV